METLERNTQYVESRFVRSRFTRALETYDANADAQHQISRRLVSILEERTIFDNVLEIGCGTGGFTRQLKRHCIVNNWTINDLCDGCLEHIQRILTRENFSFLEGNAEEITFPDKYDLIASASVFQWMKNPGEFFYKLSNMLTAKGILLFNTFSPRNLMEIKNITGKGLAYPTQNVLREWLGDRFQILHIEEEEITLKFDSPIEVLRHLKATGVTATNNEKWTRGKQNDFCHEYAEKYSTNDGKVTLTYSPIYVMATKLIY